ncbi:MAG TPA: DUF3612 domain-containing protein [Vicinamibacteria bacterium]|nr:DUF3612 domain-containing protein [Vicinamibacteria bacterium]
MAAGLLRKTHFLGTKIRSQRRRTGLTLEDLSVRCIQLDPGAAPSVSYLSMIETGQRVPSEKVLRLLAEVFQRDLGWFLDENLEAEPAPRNSSAYGIEGMALEPGFLFSKDLLQSVIPELLSQTGTSGRQFAHLLIRSHQERYQNQFPDLERAAEDIGRKRFPLELDDLFGLCRQNDLEIRWFERKPFAVTDDAGRQLKTLVRSFFDAPRTVYINRRLEGQPARVKYELASYLGHKVLHGGDGPKMRHATGESFVEWPVFDAERTQWMESQDILFAWRDFECSFFAGALLCPKQPFRRFLLRHGYDALAGAEIGLNPAVVMRRMTSVSPYRDWHYFDAYPPGYLRAVYRGNGIPLPWGNMRLVTDPCPNWAVFQMLSRASAKPLAQISVLIDRERVRLYCCLCLRARDAAGNPHVLSVGLDLNPALESRGVDARDVAGKVAEACRRQGGAAPIPEDAAGELSAVSRILNVRWIADAMNRPASMICPRSTACPRPKPCRHRPQRRPLQWSDEIRKEILSLAR